MNTFFEIIDTVTAAAESVEILWTIIEAINLILNILGVSAALTAIITIPAGIALAAIGAEHCLSVAPIGCYLILTGIYGILWLTVSFRHKKEKTEEVA